MICSAGRSGSITAGRSLALGGTAGGGNVSGSIAGGGGIGSGVTRRLKKIGSFCSCDSTLSFNSKSGLFICSNNDCNVIGLRYAFFKRLKCTISSLCF